MDKVTWSQVVQSVEDTVREDIESGELDPHDEDAVYEYAMMWADSSEWTIYNFHVVNLWTDSQVVSDYEHEVGHAFDKDTDIVGRMRLCVFHALNDLIRETVENVKEG